MDRQTMKKEYLLAIAQVAAKKIITESDLIVLTQMC